LKNIALFLPSAVWTNTLQGLWMFEPRVFRVRAKSVEEESFMAHPSLSPESADVAEILTFLRRFAELMSNGTNAGYLNRASNLLESLDASASTAADELALCQNSYETVSRRAEALEIECDALKSDIEGHLGIASSVLAERELLGATLQAREVELSKLRDGLMPDRDRRAETSAACEQAFADLRAEFDAKRITLQATVQARSEECDLLRRDLERQRDDDAARAAASDAEMSRIHSAFENERSALEARLRACGDELAIFRTASKRERDALEEKIASLEAGPASIRFALDRIDGQGIPTIDARGGNNSGFPGTGEDGIPSKPFPAQRRTNSPADTSAIVPTATLLQARAQFEYLAREFIPLGDIASQVMCELAAYTMELALVEGQRPAHLPVDEVARSILAPNGANGN
jgi:hypothetical protein